MKKSPIPNPYKNPLYIPFKTQSTTFYSPKRSLSSIPTLQMALPTNKVLPCDSDGFCMLCKLKPQIHESLVCCTCATPWHLPCLPNAVRPATMTEAPKWECPDCSSPVSAPAPALTVSIGTGGSLIAAIRAIQEDSSLTDDEKAKKRQELVCGSSSQPAANDKTGSEVLDNKNVKCSMCIQLPERPVTTPCGHNFCLKCFKKWIGQGKRTCANCRRNIPAAMANNPRINDQLAMAIRMARQVRRTGYAGPLVTAPKVYVSEKNENLPDTAFTTERAVKKGKANACSGRIFVTIPKDYFGPITAEHEPKNNRGVLVGDIWEDRMVCRQWGAHFPHVAGIAGQKGHGAQSVALSGGYIDDEDHGEWFLYTGSGGKDLSGNKRTNKQHSFDQQFENMNEALRVSCKEGYPVRVVRSHKEKRSSYAPQFGVRYDGVYRIEKCWRKKGVQGCLVCRYLFVRCDNEPAPWTSDEGGDRPRPLPAVKELKGAIDVTVRTKSPSWDYDEEKGCWLWTRPQPESKKLDGGREKSLDGTGKIKIVRKSKVLSVKARLKRDFGCRMCRNVLDVPVTTPCCGQNVCKACLEGAFSGKSFVRNRECTGGRRLREQKNVMKCPSCPCDIAEFLKNPEVNRQLQDMIDSLKEEAEKEEKSEESSDNSHVQEESSKESSDKTVEKPDEGADVSKPVDPSEKILEEISDNDLKKRPVKRRKGAGGAVILNTVEPIVEAAGQEDNVTVCG